jgi:hypothetical protein
VLRQLEHVRPTCEPPGIGLAIVLKERHLLEIHVRVALSQLAGSLYRLFERVEVVELVSGYEVPQLKKHVAVARALCDVRSVLDRYRMSDSWSLLDHVEERITPSQPGGPVIIVHSPQCEIDLTRFGVRDSQFLDDVQGFVHGVEVVEEVPRHDVPDLKVHVLIVRLPGGG